MDVETLAMILHEAGREAVEKGATVAVTRAKNQDTLRNAMRFIEWSDSPQRVKLGRRIQARYLLKYLNITFKQLGEK